MTIRAADCASLLVVLATGCVYVPVTTTRYDAGCQIFAEKMELQMAQIGTLGSCSNQGCAAALVAFGAVTAASAVVSGSIVVAGNVVYWFEKQGQCAR